MSLIQVKNIKLNNNKILNIIVNSMSIKKVFLILKIYIIFFLILILIYEIKFYIYI